MNEGKKPTSDSETHNEVDESSLAVTGQKNQDREEVSSGGSSSDVLSIQQEELSVPQQEILTVPEGAEAQQEAVTVAPSPVAAETRQDTLPVGESLVTVPAKSEEQSQGERVQANSSSAQMNDLFEREEIHSNDQEAALQPEVYPAAVYEFPPLELLSPPVFKAPDPEWLSEQEHMLNETLRNF